MKPLFLAFLISSFNVYGNSLLEQRTLKLSSKKASVYSDSGVFFWKSTMKNTKVKSIRSFFSKKKGYERYVVDFSTPNIPSIYGHIDEKTGKLFLDLIDASPDKSMNPGVSGKFLKSIDIFSLDKSNTSLELSFNEKYGFDIFYLNSPGRLVIDVRK